MRIERLFFLPLFFALVVHATAWAISLTGIPLGRMPTFALALAGILFLLRWLQFLSWERRFEAAAGRERVLRSELHHAPWRMAVLAIVATTGFVVATMVVILPVVALIGYVEDNPKTSLAWAPLTSGGVGVLGGSILLYLDPNVEKSLGYRIGLIASTMTIFSVVGSGLAGLVAR